MMPMNDREKWEKKSKHKTENKIKRVKHDSIMAQFCLDDCDCACVCVCVI